ncbi:MAG: sigma-70 family RNA polymerase sigma factor [Kiritimatiellae bacterium]|nr:sigma-70 family RNA polymerase sigma factor [Kiritimatiellia bacterium]
MTLDDIELRALARRAAGGDTRAAEDLVRGFHGHLIAFLYLSTIPPDDIEDVAQETALQLYRGLPAYSPDKPFLPWLRSIARHMTHNYWRTKARKDRRESAFREHVEHCLEDEQHAAVLTDLSGDRLKGCIDRLPENQQRILWLRYRTGLSAEEISKQLQRNATAVRKALSRMRQALRACIESPTAEPAPQGVET